MKLLLVEDNFMLRKSILKGLRGAGYVVDIAADGENALWHAMNNEYDVILLDLMLPVLDGLSVLRKLRLGGAPTHVLILSAKTTVSDRILGLNAGADDYLTKPFSFDELLARIAALVRRKYANKDPEIVIEHLRVDTLSQRVWREGEEIQLTPREYTLLEYMAMRKGETVSRSDAWEHLYDLLDTTTSNVIDVYVGFLRRKIDLPGKPSLIRTIRGRGYALGMMS
ncbi:MAG: response regulator transcription factor [Planctomycetes bacterium]|nr:response regulator transcription factor [Planctomycetota bacterium]